MSDLIRREDAVSAISDLLMIKLQGKALPTWNDVYQTINDVPSAEPERKTGRWIPVESQTVNGRCSVCGYESHLYENDVYGERYCPSCGAEMTRGGHE